MAASFEELQAKFRQEVNERDTAVAEEIKKLRSQAGEFKDEVLEASRKRNSDQNELNKRAEAELYESLSVNPHVTPWTRIATMSNLQSPPDAPVQRMTHAVRRMDTRAAAEE